LDIINVDGDTIMW